MEIPTLNDLKPEKYNLLEPIMNLDLTIPQSDVGTVLQDLTGARKAQILSIEDESSVSNSGASTCNSSENSNRIYIPSDAVTTLHATKDKKNTQETSSNVKKIIKAKVPLREITTYTNKLRSLSQGRGEFNIEYSDMEKVTNDRLQSILHDL
ncbi:CBM_collapsed_G0030860.mRNA.1.CDS.1 [Saccharomyces cerevisiae]|nr:CBM_collapsed_G0030860.mRNA.1.CDS.1 [Saccharomyces cerevisiae]